MSKGGIESKGKEGKKGGAKEGENLQDGGVLDGFKQKVVNYASGKSNFYYLNNNQEPENLYVIQMSIIKLDKDDKKNYYKYDSKNENNLTYYDIINVNDLADNKKLYMNKLQNITELLKKYINVPYTNDIESLKEVVPNSNFKTKIIDDENHIVPQNFNLTDDTQIKTYMSTIL